MEEHRIVCPCCGRYLFVRMTEDVVDVRDGTGRLVGEDKTACAAAAAGIELGVPEGGEKIG